MNRDYARGADRKPAEPVSTCFYIQLYLHNHWSLMNLRNFEDLCYAAQTIPSGDPGRE
jgi:hypothetical protein